MSLDITKVDGITGYKVNQYLLKKGVETPKSGLRFSKKEQIEVIKNNFTQIMQVMGLDLTDDSLIETPKRVAKMFVNEIFWGLDYQNFPKITVVDNKMKYDEMVFEKNINVMSDCEHHFRTIFGKAHVAYIPNKKVLGLSKLNRIVEFFSRRPQIQERLTEQIFYTLEYLLGTKNIAVVIEAEHMCVKQRGVEDVGSSTVTSKLGGSFKKRPELRAEFMGLTK